MSQVVDTVLSRILVISNCLLFRNALCNFNTTIVGVPTGMMRNATNVVVKTVLMGVFRGRGLFGWRSAGAFKEGRGVLARGGLAVGRRGRLTVSNRSAMRLTGRFNAPLCILSRSLVHGGYYRCGSTVSGFCSKGKLVLFTDGTLYAVCASHLIKRRNLNTSTISNKRLCALSGSNFSVDGIFFRNGGGAQDRVRFTVGTSIKRVIISGVCRLSLVGRVTGRASSGRGVLFHVGPNVSTRARSFVGANRVSSGFNIALRGNRTFRVRGCTTKLSGVVISNIRYRVNSRVFRARPFYRTTEMVVSFVTGLRGRLSVSMGMLGLNNKFKVGCMDGSSPLAPSSCVGDMTRTMGRDTGRRGLTYPFLIFRPKESVITPTNVALCAINDMGRVGSVHACMSVSNNVNSGPECVLCRTGCDTILTGGTGRGTAGPIAVTKGYYRSNSLVNRGVVLPGIRIKSAITVLTANTCGCSVTDGCGHVPHPPVITISGGGGGLVMGQRACSSVVGGSLV